METRGFDEKEIDEKLASVKEQLLNQVSCATQFLGFYALALPSF